MRSIAIAFACRSIKTLFNFDPPVTDDEIRAASLQFVRKLSGFHSPSKSNEAAFFGAIDEMEAASKKLLPRLSGVPTSSQRSCSSQFPSLSAFSSGRSCLR
jgi:hypothetical protein